MWRTPLAKLALKNTLWLVIGTGLSKCLKLILIVIAARLLGVAEYGRLTFAFGFVSLFMIFSDLGFSSIVTREFAVGGRTEKDFSSLFSLKLLLSIGTLLLMAVLGVFFQKHDVYATMLLFAMAGIISGTGTFFYSLFQAKQKMQHQAWATLLEAALVTIFGFFILFISPSANHLATAYLIGSALAFFVVSIFFHRKIFPLALTWDPAMWKSFLSMAWPMAGVLLFLTLYFDLSSVMLGILGTLQETAWFNAGYRLVSVLLIGLNLISVSFFPALSVALKGPREHWESLWNVEFHLLFYVMVPLVVGGTLLAPQIIAFVYGPEFAAAASSLRWTLMTAGVLAFFIPLKDILVAAHQQKKTLMVVLLSALLNFVLNLILIPRYGIAGVHVSLLTASIAGVLIAWIFTPAWIGFPKTRPVLLRTVLTASFSAGVMGFVIERPFILQLPVAMVILIGAAVYAFLVLLLMKKPS